MIRKLREDLEEMFPVGTKVKPKGMGRRGVVAEFPEGDKRFDNAFNVPVLWDGDAKVTEVCYVRLEKIPEEN